MTKDTPASLAATAASRLNIVEEENRRMRDILAARARLGDRTCQCGDDDVCMVTQDRQKAETERDTLAAENARLLDLVSEAGSIIAEYAPGHTVWLEAASYPNDEP